MARPLKRQRVSFWVLHRQWEKLKALARQSKRTASEQLRGLIDAAVDVEQQDVPDIPEDGTIRSRKIS